MFCGKLRETSSSSSSLQLDLLQNMDVETWEISARHVNASQWHHPYLGRSLDPFLTRVEHGCTPVIADQLLNSDDMWVKCGVPSSLPASDVFFALAKTHPLFTDEQFKPSWIPWAPSCFVWGFPYKQGTPIAGWSVMDHPMENMDDLEVPGTPILGKPPYLSKHSYEHVRPPSWGAHAPSPSNLCCVANKWQVSWAKSLRFRIFRCFICNFSCKSHDFSWFHSSFVFFRLENETGTPVPHLRWAPRCHWDLKIHNWRSLCPESVAGHPRTHGSLVLPGLPWPMATWQWKITHFLPLNVVHVG